MLAPLVTGLHIVESDETASVAFGLKVDGEQFDLVPAFRADLDLQLRGLVVAGSRTFEFHTSLMD